MLEYWYALVIVLGFCGFILTIGLFFSERNYKIGLIMMVPYAVTLYIYTIGIATRNWRVALIVAPLIAVGIYKERQMWPRG